MPNNKGSSAKERHADEAELHFPFDADIGTPPEDIPIIVVYNGFNHFCATKPPKPTFKDGVKELVSLLSNARVLCDKLGKGTQDPLVKQVFSKASENSQTAMYSVDKLIQTAHEAPKEEAEAPSHKRKRRDSGDNKIERKARDGSTKWTKTTCKCGIEKHTKEELKAHIERRHADGMYKCPYEDCGMVTKFTSSIQKHVQNQHMDEYYYWCMYCTDYKTDQKHLLTNHMCEKHGYGLKLPCTKFGCNKLFSSEVSRNDHMKYCQEAKKFACTDYPPCKKTFKREKNLKYHIEVVHIGSKDKISCDDCKNIYQSRTSYLAHKRNDKCIVLEEDLDDDMERETSEGAIDLSSAMETD